jgi:WD40 repeat protein
VIVTGRGDSTVRVWDAETGEPRAVVTGHTGGVRTVAVGQVSARTVIVTGGGGTVRVWDAKTGKPQATLAHLGGILAVTVGQLDYRTLMVVGADSRIAVVELLRLPG